VNNNRHFLKRVANRIQPGLNVHIDISIDSSDQLCALVNERRQTNCMVGGINVPIQIGKVTVMPGDVVFGDTEGVYFIPPSIVKQVVDAADTVHIHDEWTKKKFDENKYKSTDIYPAPRAEDLKKEYQEYLKQKLGRQEK